MSIIGKKVRDESIYDILGEDLYARPKTPIYVSETLVDLKRQHSSKPKSHATMGYPEVPLKSSDEFLKKGEGIHAFSKTQKKQCLINDKLPPLPKEDHNYSRKKKDRGRQFRVENKKWVKEMPLGGLKETPVVVDSSDGHTSDVYRFKWVYNESFGNVPKYLARRNEMVREEERKYKKKLEEDEPLCKPLSPREREHLLTGLKENWDELQKEFLLLPVLIDTVPKVIRKTKLEAKLRQLETDIRMVEENPYIYIYD